MPAAWPFLPPSPRLPLAPSLPYVAPRLRTKTRPCPAQNARAAPNDARLQRAQLRRARAVRFAVFIAAQIHARFFQSIKFTIAFERAVIVARDSKIAVKYSADHSLE